jgi:hypothetical protein
MATNQLAGIQTKIKWAKKHIRNLNKRVLAFSDAEPYSIGVKHDPKTRELVDYVSHVEDVPADIAQIAGDAVFNLVSILDHLAYRLFLKSGGKPPDGRLVYFPIGSRATTAEKHKSECARKVKGISPPIVDALFAVEAYKGGKGQQLWSLNELNNLSKHRELMTVAVRIADLEVGADGASFPGIAPKDPLCPLKVGDELFRRAPDDKVHQDIGFTVDVAIHEPQIAETKSVVETLHHFLNLVHAIVQQFTAYL